MNSKNLKITRRNLMLAGSAAIAMPMAASAAAPSAEASAKSAAAAKPAATAQTIYFIGHNCIGCQVCRMNCPASAIDFGDDRNVINQKKCIHCGTCYQNCPLTAISAK
jgi:ferredoxin